MSGIFSRVGWAGSAMALLALLVLFGLPTTQVSAAGAISQSYTTKSKSLSRGALLSLVSSGSTTVEPANSTTNLSRLIGVAADESLVEFSDGGTGSTKVVTEGLTEVLVSDLNGPVRSGDKITASPVGGIGMKAIVTGEVVGTAQADMTSVTTVSQSITSSDGKQQTMKVGLLPVSVSVNFYSPAVIGQDTLSTLVPSVVQTMANAIAGHPVSAIRVLLSGAVLFIGFLIVALMLYTSIRNGMISIGRNPLAQKMVRKGLLDVIAAALAVLIISAAIVYATLKV